MLRLVNRQSSIVNRQSSIVNRQSSISPIDNRQSSIVNLNCMHSLVSPSTLGRLVDIALAAGAAAMQFYGQSDGIELKRDGTPVTRADRAAHDIIVPALKRLAAETAAESARMSLSLCALAP